MKQVVVILRSRASSDCASLPEIDIVRVGPYDTCRKYIFDFKKHTPDGDQCVNALSFSQQQLLQEVTREHYNVLLFEGWVHLLKSAVLEMD